MKYCMLFVLGFFLFGCNLAEWNQGRLNKKFKRKGVEEFTYESDSSSIHYYKGGSGPTLLLIHGFGGDAQVTWEKTILELSQDYTIIAPDLLWFGQSSSTKNPNLKAQVTAVFELLDYLNVERCHIAGVSYGGFVTLGMIQEKPMLFTKVCIVDSPGMTYNTDLLEEMCKEVGVEEPADIFVPKSSEEVRRLFQFAFHKKKNYSNGILQDAYELYFSKNHDELTTLLRTLPEEQVSFFEEQIRPYPESIVIWGEHDEVFPKSEGKKLANFLNCEFKTIPDAGHAPMIEQSKKFNAILSQFLQQQ